MAKDTKHPENATPYEYKLADRFKSKKSYTAEIDGCSIVVYPDMQEIAYTSDGQRIPKEFTPAYTVVTNKATGERTVTTGGFANNLTPDQVYQLLSAGIITLSRLRPNHHAIISKFLTENVPQDTIEDY